MVDRLVNEGQEKVVWPIAWSQATVQRCIQMPSFTKETWRIKTLCALFFKEHADIDAVIHFAAYSLVAESMADPLKYFDNNTAGMVKLLEVMHECGCLYRLFFNCCT